MYNEDIVCDHEQYINNKGIEEILNEIKPRKVMTNMLNQNLNDIQK